MSRITDRIIGLENNLKWYQSEFNSLIDVKKRNDDKIKELKEQCQYLTENTEQMKDQAKASKRQNKLLDISLNKAKEHNTALTDIGQKIQD